MKEYQVVARKYRPQTFADVIGQNAIVTTLKNALRSKRFAHAYLLCGPQGTGKTTIARILAKALNCTEISEELEPCNKCTSCREVTSGSSLDVLEIDGASNRGIDEIRRISDTVGYTPATGKYKVIIIDEVHMLTKEAFNALLKTLEEPPSHAKFFFATTEPHKVLPTILSRCQRFNLGRISLEDITGKLVMITQNMEIEVAEETLRLIAHRAHGGMRDAESLLDQIIAFTDGNITYDAVVDILGVMPREEFFRLDEAGKNNDIAVAFDVVEKIFAGGKDVAHFLETLVGHYRTMLYIKVTDKNTEEISQQEYQRYRSSAKEYTKEQILYVLDMLIEVQGKIKMMPSQRVTLEVALMNIIRSRYRVPLDVIAQRLMSLEEGIAANSAVETPAPVAPVAVVASPPQKKKEEKKVAKPPKVASKPAIAVKTPVKKAVVETPEERIKRQSKDDTLLHFAAVELEGTITKKTVKK
jgi:DNA polymerase III subunit gamma/tau